MAREAESCLLLRGLLQRSFGSSNLTPSDMAPPNTDAVRERGPDLDQGTAINTGRLHIRVVPYSPPRLSSVGSTPPRPASFGDRSPSLSGEQMRVQNGYEMPSSPNLRIEPASEVEQRSNSANANGSDVKYAAALVHDSRGDIASSPSSPTSSSSSIRCQRRIITINPNQTFSLAPQRHTSSTKQSRRQSPRPSALGPLPAGRVNSKKIQPCSTSTMTAEPSVPPADRMPEPTRDVKNVQHSAWNYEFIGGLRKVIDNARNGKVKEKKISSPFPVDAGVDNLTIGRPFQSHPQNSIAPKEPNYQTYTSESHCSSPQSEIIGDTHGEDTGSISAASSRCNLNIIHASPSAQSLDDTSQFESSDSDANYMIHDQPSSQLPSPGRLKKSLGAGPARLESRYIPEQDMMSRQRDSDSARSFSFSSISSASVEEAARLLFAGTSTTSMALTPVRQISARPCGKLSGKRVLHSSHHQWNTTLSTVMSESERDSQAPSASLPQLKTETSRRERCPNPHRGHSDSVEETTEAGVDRPRPAFYSGWSRQANNSTLRLICDQDEHGDGLAELALPFRRPSRTRLHSYLSNFPSDRNLHSSSSSHSYSFSRSYIPTWARQVRQMSQNSRKVVFFY